MKRETIVSIHLYLAAVFAPIIIFMGVSGELYLLGQKGWTEKTVVYEGDTAGLNRKAKNMDEQIRSFILQNSINHEFEYVKGGGRNYFTRPTSKTHLQFQFEGDQLKVTQHKPSIIRSMVELHKGHGPSLFKTLQKVTAFALVIIILSGVITGLFSRKYAKTTTVAISLGSIITLLIALI